jgi:hypothetical protein
MLKVSRCSPKSAAYNRDPIGRYVTPGWVANRSWENLYPADLAMSWWNLSIYDFPI